MYFDTASKGAVPNTNIAGSNPDIKANPVNPTASIAIPIGIFNAIKTKTAAKEREVEVEYSFENRDGDELDQDEPRHDFIFIRDPFISDQNGTAVILRAGEPFRRKERT